MYVKECANDMNERALVMREPKSKDQAGWGGGNTPPRFDLANNSQPSSHPPSLHRPLKAPSLISRSDIFQPAASVDGQRERPKSTESLNAPQHPARPPKPETRRVPGCAQGTAAAARVGYPSTI